MGKSIKTPTSSVGVALLLALEFLPEQVAELSARKDKHHRVLFVILVVGLFGIVFLFY